MATPLWEYNGRNGLTYEEDSDDHQPGFFCHWGMGMQILATHAEGCRDDPFGDGVARIGHSGTAYGVQAGMWLDREHGVGVMWFATGMPEQRTGGRSAFSGLEETFARGK